MGPSGIQDKQICIIGLGYVGLTLAVAMAEAGFKIVGVETNPHILECLAKGHAHFSETGIDKRLAMVMDQGRFSAHPSIPTDDATSVYVITVGTPVGDDKKTKMGSIQAVASGLAKVMKPNDLVILRSTVRVGVSRNVVKPILDQAGIPYQMAFCPERTVEGKAIEELRSLPQIVGGVDVASTLRASQIFHTMTPSVVKVSSLEAAEMVKLINNTYRDLMFAFSNEIASAAEAAGLSAMEVIRAGNLNYPRGGVPMPGPVGGPCLEKDPYILAEGLEAHGFVPELALAGRRLNEALPGRAAASVAALAAKQDLTPKRVVVAGLAFKGRPSTSDLRGTLAIPLIAELRAQFPNAEIIGYDPVALAEEVERDLGISFEKNFRVAATGADLVVIQNNHVAFRDMDFAEISGAMSARGVIYDLWAQNEGEDLPLGNGVIYSAFGSAVVQGGALEASGAVRQAA